MEIELVLSEDEVYTDEKSVRKFMTAYISDETLEDLFDHYFELKKAVTVEKKKVILV